MTTSLEMFAHPTNTVPFINLFYTLLAGSLGKYGANGLIRHTYVSRQGRCAMQHRHRVLFFIVTQLLVNLEDNRRKQFT